MDKSGGTFTGTVRFPEVDGGCINFTNSFFINGSSSAGTLIGADGTASYVGLRNRPIILRGTGDRPLYNDSPIALQSDVAGVSKVTVSTSGNVSQTMQPNVKYAFTGTLTSLNLTLAAPLSGKRSVYSCIFYTGENTPTVKLTPNSGYIVYGICNLKSLDAGTYYILEVEDNIATLLPVYNNFLYSYTTSLSGSSTSGSAGGTLSVVYTDNSEPVISPATAGKYLKITATPNANYTLNKLTVNNVNFTSGNTKLIDEDIDVNVVFLGNTTTITWTTPAEGLSTITVTCNGTEISSGATVRFGDVISVTTTAATGYTITKTSTGLSGTASGYITAANPTITITAETSS